MYISISIYPPPPLFPLVTISFFFFFTNLLISYPLKIADISWWKEYKSHTWLYFCWPCRQASFFSRLSTLICKTRSFLFAPQLPQRVVKDQTRSRTEASIKCKVLYQEMLKMCLEEATGQHWEGMMNINCSSPT